MVGLAFGRLAVLAGLASVSMSLPTVAFGWSLGSLLHVFAEETIRYRITITLDVDGEPISGSAVQELRANAEVRTIPGTGGGVSVKGAGEAVAIEISGKPTLYFPMVGARGGAFADIIAMNFKINSSVADPVQRLDVVRNFRGPCTISPRAWPLAVRFTAEDDPNAGKQVVLPEATGPDGGVSITSVVIERTDDPLTAKIAGLLPWAAREKAVRVDIRAPDGRLLQATNSTIFFRR